MKRAALLSWSCALLLFFGAVAFADKDLSSWGKYTRGELLLETNGFAPGQLGTLGFKISLVKDWHTYWVNSGDSGAAIRLKFKSDADIKIRDVLFPWPERELTGPLITFAYSDAVLFPIEAMVSPSARPGTSALIQVEAEWLVCADVCIPAISTFEIQVPIRKLEEIQPSEHFKQFQQTRARIPLRAEKFSPLEFGKGTVRLALPELGADEEVEDFFPFRGSGVTNALAKVGSGALELEKDVAPQQNPERIGVLVLKSKTAGKQRALQLGDSGWKFTSESAADFGRIWWMLLSAFLGGLILNLMPCVFPILSMKFLGLMKLGQAHSREVREQNLAYVAGVLVSFLAIALVLSVLRSAGQLVGWGFQLQSPVFLAVLIWLFAGLTLNLLGAFEIDFLNAGLGSHLTRLGGVSGSFFTGILAVIVASPCTAPFMGAALGFGVSQPLPILFGIFLMLGLGLAFPYLLFAVFPSWTRFLPRPGVWMSYLRQVMAIPMLATMLWLLWVVSQGNSMDVVYVVAAGALLIAVGLLYKGSLRMALRVVVALMLVGGVYWIWTKPAEARITAEPDGMWQVFSEAKLASLKGQNVFVNMTADWCLSCKVNEKLVFNDAEVQAQLRQKNIVLLKGDWTQRDEEITRFLTRYDRLGVPFYVFFSSKNPAGVALPEVLTKSLFLDWMNTEFP